MIVGYMGKSPFITSRSYLLTLDDYSKSSEGRWAKHDIVGDKPVRRLWGTRIKKFGDRWMANVLEVETMGSGHRTKITVEKLK